MNDVVVNKIQSIQRCVNRAREEYEADPDGFATDYTRQGESEKGFENKTDVSHPLSLSKPHNDDHMASQKLSAVYQDAAVLNVLRACEQSIDLANHLVKTRQMGIPTASGESFDLLRQGGVIDAGLAEKLRNMVHFRNLVTHQYQRMELVILRSVIEDRLDDLVVFGDRVLAFLGDDG